MKMPKTCLYLEEVAPGLTTGRVFGNPYKIEIAHVAGTSSSILDNLIIQLLQRMSRDTSWTLLDLIYPNDIILLVTISY
jgi:hypothetical protein